MFRMRREIFVDLNFFGIINRLNRFQVNEIFLRNAFPEYQDVGNNFRSGKGSFRQTDRFHQTRFFRKRGSGFFVGGIQCGAGSQQNRTAVFFQAIQRSRNKVIVQIPALILPVIQTGFAERDIADHEIVVRHQFDVFQRSNPNIGRFRIQTLHDASRDGIHLDGGEFISALHGCKPDEIPGSGAEFRNLAGLDFQFLPDDVPHEINDIFGRVITVENGTLCRLIFFFGEQVPHILKISAALHEDFRKPAPAGKLRQHDLFITGQSPFRSGKSFQQTDCFQIAFDPFYPCSWYG